MLPSALAFLVVVALAHPAAQASLTPTDWTFKNRQVERRSTSPTELLINVTLLPDELPSDAVLGCVQATRQTYAKATFVYCTAYTPAAYQMLSGKLRLCYSASVQWFASSDSSEELVRLSLPSDDPHYPKKCRPPKSYTQSLSKKEVTVSQ